MDETADIEKLREKLAALELAIWSEKGAIPAPEAHRLGTLWRRYFPTA